MGLEHWISVGFAVGVPVWLVTEEVLSRLESTDEAEVEAAAPAEADRRTA